MILDPGEDQLLRRYLLGDLSPAERIDIDARLFLEPQYSELLKMAEEELLDDFLSDDLTASERVQFEANYRTEQPQYGSNYSIATERKQSLWFADALKQKLELPKEPVPPPSSPTIPFFTRWFGGNGPWWRIPLTAATLLLLLVGGWMIIRAVLRSQNNRPQEVKRTPPAKTERSAPLPSETPTPGEPDERVQEENTPSQPRPPASTPREQRVQRENTPPLPRPTPLMPREERVQQDNTPPSLRLPASLPRNQRVQLGNNMPPPASMPVHQVNNYPVTVLEKESIYISTERRVRGGSIPNSFPYPSKKVTTFRLSLVDEVKGADFDAELRDGNGGSLSKLPTPVLLATGEARNIFVKVPTSLIPPGDYEIVLSEVRLGQGVIPIRTYYFSVQLPDAQTAPPK